MKLLLFFTLVLGTLFSGRARADAPAFRAREGEGTLIVESPYGETLVQGAKSLDGHPDYEITIPLGTLRKPGRAGRAGDASADVEKLLAAANAAYQRADFPRALSLVNEALEKNPSEIRAILMKGSLAYLAGRREEARKLWSRAHELDPANEEITRTLEKYR